MQFKVDVSSGGQQAIKRDIAYCITKNKIIKTKRQKYKKY